MSISFLENMEMWKSWKKNEFFRFQLKRNLEMIKNKHGLVYQLLGKFGNVEMMENTEKMDFSYFN